MPRKPILRERLRCRPTVEALEQRLAPATLEFHDSLSPIGFDGAGNVYLRGSVAGVGDIDPGSGQTWATGEYLAKHDAAGGQIWTQKAETLFGSGWKLWSIVPQQDTATGKNYVFVMGVQPSASRVIAKFEDVGTGLTPVWSTTVGGYGNIAVDSGGSVYMFGFFNGTFDFDPNQVRPDDTLTSSGQDDYLLKVSATGEFQWVRQLGGDDAQWAAGITVSGGDVYVTGYFRNSFAPAGFIDGGSVNDAQSNDGFLAKYAADGTLQAAWQFIDSKPLLSRADANGVVVAGQFERTADFDPSSGEFKLTPAGGTPTTLANPDIFLLRLDTNGALSWAKQLGSTGNDTLSNVAIHDGAWYVSGCFSGTVDFELSAGQSSKTAAGGSDAFVARYGGEAASLAWVAAFGSDTQYAVAPTQETATAIVSSNGVYAGGFFAPGTADFDPGPGTATFTNHSDWDGYFLRLSHSGAYQSASQLESVVRTVDNGDSGYTETGTGWKNNTSGGFAGDSRYHAKGNGSNKAIWSLTGLPQGSYEVIATWKASTQNATNATYRVNGTSAPAVNQRLAPSDYTMDLFGSNWESLGTYSTTGAGAITVELSDAANGRVVADAIRVILRTPAAPLLAAEGENTASPSTQSLTAEQLQPILAEARARWQAAGADLAHLAALRVEIADLGGATLGLACGDILWLDGNAAGHGWFVDPTPLDDSEFDMAAGSAGFAAQGAAARHVDLLSALSHELGHVLGLHDLEPAAHAHDLMAAELAVGMRRLASGDDVDAVFSSGRW